MNFGEKIFDYKEEILRDLNELISIQSVSGTDPEEAEKALDYILGRAKEMGFETKKVGKVAGHAQFGEGKELAAVLAHVDVVPAGEGWSVSPFALTEKDGRLYGRGVVDDKGPAVIALYCLKALKDSGIEPKRRIRIIFGAEEEIGMNDMETYFASEELPDMAFTPDSEYGICLKEKGIMQLEVSAQSHDGTILTEFQSGGAVNAVPSKAHALVDCTESEDNQLRRFADAKPGEYDFIYTMDGLHISAKGKAAHASTPELGLNMATHLIRILAANFGQFALGSLCSFIDDAIGLEIDGSSLDIACSDEESGALTVNLGRVDINENICRALIDVRYPVTADSGRILRRIRQRAAYDGLKTKLLNNEYPLSMEKDAPVIEILSQAYENVIGEKPELYSTGGGTYARTLNNRGVAFGPTFSGDETHIHDVDESIDTENFWTHARICLEAIKGLCGVPPQSIRI